VESYFPEHKAAIYPSGFCNETTTLINAFLFVKIEEPDLRSGYSLKRDAENGTYSHAQKIRAAISYHYAWVEELAARPWIQDAQGRWSGNPSLAVEVVRYMRALRRQKVQFSYEGRRFRGSIY
jgi:hypothetical protein